MSKAKDAAKTQTQTEAPKTPAASMLPKDDQTGTKTATVAPVKTETKIDKVRAGIKATGGYEFEAVKNWLNANKEGHGVDDANLSTMLSQEKKKTQKTPALTTAEGMELIFNTVDEFGGYEGLTEALAAYGKVAELVGKFGGVDKVTEAAKLCQSIEARALSRKAAK